MGEAFTHYYKFRDIGKKGIPVFLHCIHGTWACQIGFDFGNSGTSPKLSQAIKKALEIYEYNEMVK